MSEPTKPNYQQMEQYQQLRFTRITTSVVTEPVNQGSTDSKESNQGNHTRVPPNKQSIHQQGER
jgi:hypothetical protein